ncbi:KOW motif-containing protein [Candidatus Nanohalococcus occultus]|uniref:Ribosomal protein S4E n=1 Tax=Candidatus Nanohalococcus occultus TaxID=2978047 RepID=A0ABY8CIP9_9ARCH|nr:Ribosomal protein S4E [Candidatus Nanohaloarchaeota archaeon SVXNc]
MTHNKRLPAPKHYPINRKESSYVSEIKGSRSRDTAIPTVVFLREVTEYADNAKEATKIVKEGKILRNGDKLRDIKQGIGVLDVVQFPDTEESFRAVKQGKKLVFLPVTDGDKVAAKILDKSVEGDEFVYRLHNGENFRTEDEFSTGNTLVFNDSVKEVELAEGNQALVIEGSHAGEKAEIKEINRRGMKPDTATVESDREFETRLGNLVAVENLEVTR